MNLESSEGISLIKFVKMYCRKPFRKRAFKRFYFG